VIDYLRERFEDKLSGYDCAFDLLGGDTLARLWKVLRRGGHVVSIAGIPEPMTARKDLGRGSGLAALFWVASLTTRLRAARHGVSYRYLFMHPSGADLAYLGSLIEAKKLEVVSTAFFRSPRPRRRWPTWRPATPKARSSWRCVDPARPVKSW
jgi:NADPH:quinone reductase-like Zn-dependent oxidoreductase